MTDPLVPAFSRPARNRRVLLVRRPAGIPQVGDFALDEAAIDTPGDGEFLVRNIYLSVDPAARLGQRCRELFRCGPLGTPMRAMAVGVVVQSRHPDYAEGCFVYGWLGWQDYAVIAPDQIMTRIATPAAPLSAYAGILGLNGTTAYIAFTKLGQPQAGETVLVSTAAGAVGSVVGQLARAASCRVVGLTGSDDKASLCTARFGYDAAINYKTVSDIGSAVRHHAPAGVDIYFDNVGGPILDAALRVMRPAGRVIQCGTASIASWAPAPQGLRNEREVLTRRLIWSGFILFDHDADYPRALAALTGMVTSGALAHDEDIATGIEHAPDSIRLVYAGENNGKKLIYVG